MGEGETPSFLVGHGEPHRARERRRVATGRPGLRLRFYPGVPIELRRFLPGFVRWLRVQLRFADPVLVTVVSQATVMGLDGVPGWAVFLIPGPDHQRGDLIRIFLAGGKLRLLERVYGFCRDRALRGIAHDLAHELVHYEQWRDRAQVSEEGVNERAASLVRSYLEGLGGT